MRTCRIVYRSVSRFAERAKNIRYFFREDALVAQTTKSLFKGLAFTEVECMIGEGEGCGDAPPTLIC
jgi:hypothetical protein